jgi:hypothetical protein
VFREWALISLSSVIAFSVSGIELGVDEMNDDMRWLAAYRIVSLRTRGDSSWARAVITSTARQKDDGYGWTARYGIREDAAHWMLVRSAEVGGAWMVRVMRPRG